MHDIRNGWAAKEKKKFDEGALWSDVRGVAASNEINGIYVYIWLGMDVECAPSFGDLHAVILEVYLIEIRNDFRTFRFF